MIRTMAWALCVLAIGIAGLPGEALASSEATETSDLCATVRSPGAKGKGNVNFDVAGGIINQTVCVGE
jgi:hypothetical protein